MTYIKLTDDMKLITTQSENIYRGDNMSKAITFLLPIKIGELETKNSVVFLSLILPNGVPDIIALERSEVMYSPDYYRYVLPVTCKLSHVVGSVRMWLQFLSGDPTDPTTSKTSECIIKILNSENLDHCMTDHQISALYQIHKKIEELSNNNPPSNEGNNGGNTGEDNPDDTDDSSGDIFWEDM